MTNKMWSKLADFPSTNGLMVAGITMWLVTCAVAMVLGFVGKEVPGSWYNALNLYTGTVVVQFGLKRFSDAGYVEAKAAAKASSMIPAPRLSGSTLTPIG